MKVSVAQLGGRMHYGVARILEKEGILESLFTDFYAGPILGVLNKLCLLYTSDAADE